MNDFFTHLIGRHLGTSDTIQPRTLGRFEVDRSGGMLDSPDEGINSVVSGVNVTSVRTDESDLMGLEKDDSSSSQLELSNPSTQQDFSDEGISSVVSAVNVATVTSHESDLMGSKKDDSSSSHLKLSKPSTQVDLTEQQEVQTDSHFLPNRPYAVHPFDEVVPDTQAPNSRATEHNPENELNHRIRAMLQRLVGAAVNEQGRQQYEGQISIPSEKETPLLNAAVVSLDSVPNSQGQTNRQKNVSADGENTALYEPLQAPSWLPEIENRFNTHLKDNETKIEPVINVTIGRVEVRAVQAEAPQKTRYAKKPIGVMPLDEYLKKRDDRGMR